MADRQNQGKGQVVTVVKKVRPYPIDATLETGATKKPVEIQLLTLTGVVVRLTSGIVSVGEHHQVSFEIPASKHLVAAKVRVFKTFDKPMGTKQLTVERMAELHFESLEETHRGAIAAFIKAIRQK